MAASGLPGNTTVSAENKSVNIGLDAETNVTASTDAATRKGVTVEHYCSDAGFWKKNWSSDVYVQLLKFSAESMIRRKPDSTR